MLVLPCLLIWCGIVLRLLRDISRDGKHLIEMHVRADHYGFGTVKLTQIMLSTDRHQRETVHYVKWAVKKLTGEEPPPPTPETGT